MTMYVRKPTTPIHAIQFTGDKDEIENFLDAHGGCNTFNWFFDGSSYYSFYLQTLEGLIEYTVGYWIVKGSEEGEFYGIRPDRFEALYEKEKK